MENEEEYYDDCYQERDTETGNNGESVHKYNTAENHGYDHYSYYENGKSYDERKDEYEDQIEYDSENALGGEHLKHNGQSPHTRYNRQYNNDDGYQGRTENNQYSHSNYDGNHDNNNNDNNRDNCNAINKSVKDKSNLKKDTRNNDARNVKNISTSSTTSSKLKKRRDDYVIQVLTDADLGI